MLTKLTVYSGRDLQNFMSLLNYYVSIGTIDARLIQSHVQNEIHHRSIASKKTPDKQVKVSVCPQCGSNKWRATKDEDGVWYTLCKDCQYSELLGDR